MKWFTASSNLLFGCLLEANIAEALVETTVYPVKYRTTAGFGDYVDGHCQTLNSTNKILTLDYGVEVGGFPFFDVNSLSGPVQVELKYSEPKAGLDMPFSDGPWTFSNGLAGTFRVETFSVNTTGNIASYFIQGGLRWQKMTLLTEGSMEICSVGFKTQNDRTPIASLEGSFTSSNDLYNQIWAMGPRTVQQACVAADTAPTTWDITADGALIRGQQPAVSVHGGDFANYTMDFDTKIVRGGTGWKVAAGVGGLGAYFVMSSEYPEATTFVNTNLTLAPPNTIALGYGWNLVNQTSLTTGKVQYFHLPFDVKEDEWYHVSTIVNATGYGVTVNGTTIFAPVDDLQTVTSYSSSSGSLSGGTIGFGPYQDQVAFVKNVEVYAENGTLIYENTMTSEDTLEEYGVMANTHNLCLDGAKRDRLVWAGDFAHTYRVLAASTYQEEFAYGTLEYILARQGSQGANEGWFSMSPAMGTSDKYTDIYASFGLLDYQFLYLDAFAGYCLQSGNTTFMDKYYSQAKKGVEVTLPLIDESSGLAVPTNGAFFMGSANATAPSAALVYTLKQMSKVAQVMNDTDSATTWNSSAVSLSAAINNHLWSESLGSYATDLNTPNEIDLAGTAWSILSGVANETQAQSAIAALSSLRLGVGYKDSTSTASSSDTAISPFLSGFLLEGVLRTSRSSNVAHNATGEVISVLLDNLWASMIDQDAYYTGTVWEYVFPDGRPGLDAYTSHAHPWAASPTYILTEYVLGVQSVSPGFKQWEFRPAVLDVDVTWVSGKVPTPLGTIEASWDLSQADIVLEICSPSGTSGTVALPFAVSSYKLNKKTQNVPVGNFEVTLQGGSCATIDVVKK